VLFLLIGYGPLLTGQTPRQASANAPPEYTFALVRVFPHDISAYTQGLAYRDGFLYEGTGRNVQSSLRKVRLETGSLIRSNMEYANGGELGGQLVICANREVVRPRDGRGLPV
jgi:glutamine cyclotransferase